MLEDWSTGGEKETGVGVTRAAGAYVGTEATAGLTGVVDGGNAVAFWVIGDTTLTGLWGLGRTKGGGALTGAEGG